MVGSEERTSREPLLFTVDRDDNLERIPLTIPEAGYLLLYSVAGGPDGSLAVVGRGFHVDGRQGSFVARIAPDRKSQTITRTWPYVGTRVTVAPDGLIWTAGWAEPSGSRTQYNVFRVFDESGRSVREFVVLAKGRPDTPSDAVPYSVLKSSRDRVGWLTSGWEYLEFSLDGREIGRLAGPLVSQDSNLGSIGLALSEDNRVVIGILVQGKHRMWALDRERQTWSSIEEPDAGELQHRRILGFDGQSLVTLRWGKYGVNTVHRYRIVGPRENTVR
jgi:hypothetical protein